MKKWFSTLRYKINEFMQGRYGYDELSSFMAIGGLVLMVLSHLPHFHFLYIFAFPMLVWSWIRALSRNIHRRQMERNKYLSIKNRLVQRIRLYKNIWAHRKTHRYYRCPGCKTFVRIKKPEIGRRIMVTCPKCNERFEKRA